MAGHLGSRAWDACLAENADVNATLRRAQRAFDIDADKLRGPYRGRFVRVLVPRFMRVRNNLARAIRDAARGAMARNAPMTGPAPPSVHRATLDAIRASKTVHEALEQLLAEQDAESA